MTVWRFIESGPGTAPENMAIDAAVSETVRKGFSAPTLRFYGWIHPSVTIGAHQKSSDVDISVCIRENIPVVRRQTGGRGILHSDELTYSFTSPNTGWFAGGLRQSYLLINSAIREAIERFGVDIDIRTTRQVTGNPAGTPVCFHTTSFGELSFQGMKIAGSAQKRHPEYFLQQGSIPYSVNAVLIREVFPGRRQDTGSPDGNRFYRGLRSIMPEFNAGSLSTFLLEAFERCFRVRMEEVPLSDEEKALARHLALTEYRPLRESFLKQGTVPFRAGQGQEAHILSLNSSEERRQA